MDVTKEYKERDSFLKWFMIAALSGVDMKSGVIEVPRNLVLTLNGIELNVIHALKRLEEEFDRIVDAKVDEKLSDHYEI